MADGEPTPQAVAPLPVQPVLEYATRDADRLPDVVPEADALIEQGASPGAIRRHFGDADQAVRYFGKAMSRRFAPDTLGDACDGCGGDGRHFAVELRWVAAESTRLFESFVRALATASFSTVHPMCESCGNRWATRAPRLERALVWLGRLQNELPSLFIAALLAGEVARVTGYLSRQWPFHLAGWLLVTVGIVAGLRGLLYAAWRFALPPAVTRLMRPGVTLNGVTAVFAREGGTLRSLTD